MPYIQITTGAKLSQRDKQEITAGMNEVITAIPGKNPANTMLSLKDDVFMVFGERESKDCLQMHILLYGKAALGEKAKVTADACKLFERVLGVKADGVYVTFQELDNWGAKGLYK